MGSFRASAKLGERSTDVFASLEEQATQNAWYEALRLPRTWITEHSLLALHVWILHNRFKVDYNVPATEFSGRRMQEELFERFWEDTTRRIRNAGVAELSTRVASLQGAAQALFALQPPVGALYKLSLATGQWSVPAVNASSQAPSPRSNERSAR
jgi:hypothetical protein